MELIAHITQDIRYVVEHKEHQSSQIQPFHLSSFHLKHSVLIRITGGNAQFFFDLNETLPQMIYSDDIIYIEKGCTFSNTTEQSITLRSVELNCVRLKYLHISLISHDKHLRLDKQKYRIPY